jgi:hypothetical protein
LGLGVSANWISRLDGSGAESSGLASAVVVSEGVADAADEEGVADAADEEGAADAADEEGVADAADEEGAADAADEEGAADAADEEGVADAADEGATPRLPRGFLPSPKRSFISSRSYASSPRLIKVIRSPLGSRCAASPRTRSSNSRNSPSAVKCTP